METLSIIVCVNEARTLAYLWHKSGVFQIGGVHNNSIDSAYRAVSFIDAGVAFASCDELPSSDIYLVGCPDSSIRYCCQKLVDSGRVTEETIVFHLSGALSSSELSAAAEAGAAVASTHPVKSFADPEKSIEEFRDSWCGVEGDSAALDVLEPAFARIGGVTFYINPEYKILYHAASVIACNYLVALEEASLQTFEKAGVERELALQILAPILHGTVDNIIRLGPRDALTGPIARGDSMVIEKELEALAEWKPEIGEIYRQLGKLTAEIGEQQGNAPEAALKHIRDLLK